jgi:hypothetical protein
MGDSVITDQEEDEKEGVAEEKSAGRETSVDRLGSWH